ncbi:MAG TPA: LysR family transcriptional regulator, partial [Candidatus Caccousia avistercoris]|nr:LysR family transcriptional regulator [Candidatus Caccousia avistercoris]
AKEIENAQIGLGSLNSRIREMAENRYTLLSNAALLVEEGLGCAFCMDGALAIHSSPHLRFVPIHPQRTTCSVLVWKKNRLFSSAASLFLQEINMLRARME